MTVLCNLFRAILIFLKLTNSPPYREGQGEGLFPLGEVGGGYSSNKNFMMAR